MAARVWVRDAIISTLDIGSADGTWSIDLLLKARAGKAHGGESTSGPPALGALPAVQDGAKSNIYPDMRASYATGIPQQLPLQGARVLRTIIEYGFTFAELGGTAPGYTAPLAKGWWEGVIVAPWEHEVRVIGYGDLTTSGTVLGHPGDASDSVQLDWLWWSRKYVNANALRRGEVGGFTGEIRYDSIDTKSSRRLNEYGLSLYWQVSPSGVTPEDPAQGATINSIAASWSVLLELPG